MNTKLTLNLNQNITKEAKVYARRNHISLSKLIENYLNSLTKPSLIKNKVSPLVESLTGIIPHENLELALASDFKDFEDAVQYQTAIVNKQDIIITRNKKDYKTSELPVLSAMEFLNKRRF